MDIFCSHTLHSSESGLLMDDREIMIETIIKREKSFENASTIDVIQLTMFQNVSKKLRTIKKKF